MQLNNAITLQGFLWKQSPGVLKIFQKRYFTIRNNGQYILWFGKKPNSVDVQPKGVIVTIRIETIKPDDFDQRIFTFNYNSRWFIIRAENKQIRDRWIRAISTIIQHLKKALKNKINDLKSQPTGWKFANASQDMIKSIRMQNEKLIIREGEDNLFERSQKQLASIIGLNATPDIEKCIISGFLNKKGFIGSEQKWYFLYSQFNLSDERDQNHNQKIQPFFETLIKQQPKKGNKIQISSDQSQQQKIQQNVFKINQIYQYNIKSNTLTQKIQLINIISYDKQITQSPYILKISYGIYDQNDPDKQQIIKQLIFLSEYMTQIQKWFKALQIIFQKYNIKKQRQATIQKRFQKYQAKMVKINDQTQWRMIGTNNKPQFILVNRQILKVIGHSFSISDINSEIITTKMSISFKQDPNDQPKNKQAIILSISFKQNQKIQLAFQSKQISKNLKKKLKKNIKRIQQQNNIKKGQKINIQKQQNTQDTYLIDKKIRQASSSLKLNFYQMMQRDIPSTKQQKQQKPQSFFDKFMSMFCGPPKQQDYLYS